MDIPIVSALSLEFLLGAVIVGVYAWERFNTPPTNRASTTAGRYHTSALAYLGVSLLSYWLFTRYPQLLVYVKPAEGAPIDLPSDQTQTSSAVVVAMLLSALLPKIPVLAHLDCKLRAFLQDLAEIPMEAIRLSKLIRRARFNPYEQAREAIRSGLLSRGFDVEDIVFDTGDDRRAHSPHALWVRVTALKLGIESWEDQRGFAGFIQRRREEYKALERRYEQITEVAKNCFSLLRAAHAGDACAPLADAVGKFRANFVDQAEELAKDLSLFAAHGVLQCQLTHGTRCQALKAMGFEPPPPPETTPSGLSVNRVLTLFVILVPLLLINFIIFQPHDTGRQGRLVMVTMIGTIDTLAVVCALYPKGQWEFFRRGEDSTRPMAGYVISGLAAVALAIPINLAFKTLILLGETTGDTWALALAWNHFVERSYPWMLMAFTSAVTTAFMADNQPSRRLSARHLRWLEGIGQAVVSILAAILVLWWLRDIRPEGDLPNTFGVLRNAVIAGFVLGFLVPSWYRRATSRRSDSAASDSADSPYEPETVSPPKAVRLTAPGSLSGG